MNTDYLDLARMVAGERPVLPGWGNRDHPRYMFVGSYPVPKDFIIGRPFAGPQFDVIKNALDIINGAVNEKLKEQGKPPITLLMEDQYYTYFVKALHRPNETLGEDYIKSYLPVIQREAESIRPQNIVCLGSVAKPFAGAIPAWEYTPETGWVEKVRSFLGV